MQNFFRWIFQFLSKLFFTSWSKPNQNFLISTEKISKRLNNNCSNFDRDAEKRPSRPKCFSSLALLTFLHYILQLLLPPSLVKLLRAYNLLPNLYSVLLCFQNKARESEGWYFGFLFFWKKISSRRKVHDPSSIQEHLIISLKTSEKKFWNPNCLDGIARII